MKLFNVITTPFDDSKDGVLYYEKQDQGNKNNQNLVIRWNMCLTNAEWFYNKGKASKVFEKLKQVCPEIKLQSVQLVEEEV